MRRVSKRKLGICRVEGCGTKLIQARGYCAKHFARLQRNGDPLVLRPKPVFVTRDNGCIERVDRTVASKLVGEKKIRLYVIVLEKKLGRPLKPGYYACHHCDNRRCINEAHLFEGTQKDNIRDCINKGRFKGFGWRTNADDALLQC